MARGFGIPASATPGFPVTRGVGVLTTTAPGSSSPIMDGAGIREGYRGLGTMFPQWLTLLQGSTRRSHLRAVVLGSWWLVAVQTQSLLEADDRSWTISKEILEVCQGAGMGHPKVVRLLATGVPPVRAGWDQAEGLRCPRRAALTLPIPPLVEVLRIHHTQLLLRHQSPQVWALLMVRWEVWAAQGRLDLQLADHTAVLADHTHRPVVATAATAAHQGQVARAEAAWAGRSLRA